MRRKAFNMFFSFLYPVADFLTIAFAIMVSYKVYRILGVGRYVYYEKIHIIPMSLMASLAAVIILFIFGAYRSADYADLSAFGGLHGLKTNGIKTLCWNKINIGMLGFRSADYPGTICRSYGAGADYTDGKQI